MAQQTEQPRPRPGGGSVHPSEEAGQPAGGCCVQEQVESPSRPCRPFPSLQDVPDAVPCPGWILGAHRVLCTTGWLGLSGGEGPSTWPPWLHALVMSHPLPL